MTVSQPGSAGCFEIKLVGLLIASVLLNTYTERLKAFVFFAPFRNLQRQQNANKQPFFSSGHAKPVKKTNFDLGRKSRNVIAGKISKILENFPLVNLFEKGV